MDDTKKDKQYYGWSDIADLPEAIIFYAEMFSRGNHHHEICKMLDKYFPRIDTITLSKIRTNAYRWLRSLATNIETKMYLAKSMVRLERICANENEKTRNVLVADKQLSDLLRLTEAPEQDGPEDLAKFLREFNKQTREATDGTSFKKAQETETQETETQETETQETETQETETQVRPIDEFTLTDEEIKINDFLQKSRAERLKEEAKVLKRSIKTVSDEIDAENEQRRKLQEQDEDDED